MPALKTAVSDFCPASSARFQYGWLADLPSLTSGRAIWQNGPHSRAHITWQRVSPWFQGDLPEMLKGYKGILGI
eukprot:886193-Pelagomonas_calceolata.AAC.1